MLVHCGLDLKIFDLILNFNAEGWGEALKCCIFILDFIIIHCFIYINKTDTMHLGAKCYKKLHNLSHIIFETFCTLY